MLALKADDLSFSTNDALLAKLRHGLELDGRKLKPAIVEKIKAHELRFILKEGRNRQIRRMCQLVDLRVADLLRTRIGPLELAVLPEGKWRPISGRERDALLKAETPSPRKTRPDRVRPDRAGSPPRAGGQVAKAKRPASGKDIRRDKTQPALPDRTPSPYKGEKFKRTRLGPRKRSPIK